MSESAIMKDIQITVSKLGHRLFRNNVALAWVGKVVRTGVPTCVTVYPGDVLLRAARPMHCGLCVGSGDLIGFSKTGRFISLEVKTATGILSTEQQSFITAVNSSGGIAFCARSVDDAVKQLL
jgi:hypothetical protein